MRMLARKVLCARERFHGKERRGENLNDFGLSLSSRPCADHHRVRSRNEWRAPLSQHTAIIRARALRARAPLAREHLFCEPFANEGVARASGRSTRGTVVSESQWWCVVIRVQREGAHFSRWTRALRPRASGPQCCDRKLSTPSGDPSIERSQEHSTTQRTARRCKTMQHTHARWCTSTADGSHLRECSPAHPCARQASLTRSDGTGDCACVHGQCGHHPAAAATRLAL